MLRAVPPVVIDDEAGRSSPRSRWSECNGDGATGLRRHSLAAGGDVFEVGRVRTGYFDRIETQRDFSDVTEGYRLRWRRGMNLFASEIQT